MKLFQKKEPTGFFQRNRLSEQQFIVLPPKKNIHQLMEIIHQAMEIIHQAMEIL